MRPLPRRTVLTALVACVAAPVASFAQADYGSAPIKLIVPFPPGGGTDAVARLIVDRIRGGAGWTFVAGATPDIAQWRKQP